MLNESFLIFSTCILVESTRETILFSLLCSALEKARVPGFRSGLSQFEAERYFFRCYLLELLLTIALFLSGILF